MQFKEAVKEIEREEIARKTAQKNNTVKATNAIVPASP